MKEIFNEHAGRAFRRTVQNRSFYDDSDLANGTRLSAEHSQKQAVPYRSAMSSFAKYRDYRRAALRQPDRRGAVLQHTIVTSHASNNRTIYFDYDDFEISLA